MYSFSPSRLTLLFFFPIPPLPPSLAPPLPSAYRSLLKPTLPFLAPNVYQFYSDTSQPALQDQTSPVLKPGAYALFFFFSLCFLLHPLIEQQVRTPLPPTDRPGFPTLGLVQGDNYIFFSHFTYIFVVKVEPPGCYCR